MIDDAYNDNCRKKRRIERDAADFANQRPPMKPLPPKEPTSADRLLRAFDWAKGSIIPSLGTHDVLNDLNQMGLGIRQPYSFVRHGHPGNIPHYGMLPQAAPGPYGRSVHGAIPDEGVLMDHNGMMYQPQARYANGQQQQQVQTHHRPRGQHQEMPQQQQQPSRREGRTVPTHTADPFDRKRERLPVDDPMGMNGKPPGRSEGKGRKIDTGNAVPEDAGPLGKRRKTRVGERNSIPNPLTHSRGHLENGPMLPTGLLDTKINGAGSIPGRPNDIGMSSSKHVRRSPSPRRIIGSGEPAMNNRLSTPTSLLPQTIGPSPGAQPDWSGYGSAMGAVMPAGSNPVVAGRGAPSRPPPDLVDHRSRILNG